MAIAVIQARANGVMDQRGRSVDGEMWSDSGEIIKVNLVEFSDIPDVG